MQWNRVKTILIVIFFLVNLYLLSMYFSSTQNGISVSPSVIDDAINILQKNNIKIDKRIIPTNAPQVRVFDVTNTYGTKESLADAFLGDGYFKNDQSVFTKDNKTLWVNGGNFDIIIKQDGPIIPSLQGLNKDECINYVLDILSEYKLTNKYMRLVSTNASNGVRILSYKQVFDDNIIQDTSLTLYVTEMGISKIAARNWLGDKIAEGPFISTKTAVEALVNFANNPKVDKSSQIEITKIDECYYYGMRAPEIKTVMAIPVWRITTKKHGEFIYDARNITLIEK